MTAFEPEASERLIPRLEDTTASKTEEQRELGQKPPDTAISSLVEAVSAVLQDGSLDPLQSLATRSAVANPTIAELAAALLEDLRDAPALRPPELIEAAWSVVDAALAAGNQRSIEPLVHLASRQNASTQEDGRASELAAALLDEMGFDLDSSENPEPDNGADRNGAEELAVLLVEKLEAPPEPAEAPPNGRGAQQPQVLADARLGQEGERESLDADGGQSPHSRDLTGASEPTQQQVVPAGEPEPQSRRRRRIRLRRRKASDEKWAWYFLRDFPRIFPYVRPYWRLALASVGMVGVGAAVSLITPWPLAIVVDTVLGNKPLPALLGPLDGLGRYGLLALAVGGGLLVTLVANSLTVVDNYINTKLEQRMVLDFRSDLFRHAQQLSLAFHDKRSTGQLMYQINNLAGAVGSITLSIPPLGQALLTLVGMFLVAYKIDAELALVSLGVVPFIYYSAGFYAKRIEPHLIEVRSLEGQSMSIVHEAMAMLRVTVAFGREQHEFRRFREQGETAVNARVRVTMRQTLFSLAVNTITAAGTSAVLFFGALHVIHGRLTAGELLVVMGYVAAIYQPLEQISSTFGSLQQQFIGLRSALALLELEPDVRDAADAVALEHVRGDIRFDGVSFLYEGRDDALLDVTFAVQPGQRVAIVGPTGAGKTTLVSLLMRFYDPREGRIQLEGLDLKRVKLASLRDKMSVVLQEPLLFAGSIHDNIRYGKLEAGENEIVQAARAANAHDFISRLPEGYQTELGERGAMLSGGERQRICVARAFLKDAPILILDEPTSSIDSKTESVILDALEKLMEGRTTFMIAHRLSTIRGADLILVLDNGRLVEKGTHEALLERGGLYAQLYAAQVRREGEPGSRETADPSINTSLAPTEELATALVLSGDAELDGSILDQSDNGRDTRVALQSASD